MGFSFKKIAKQIGKDCAHYFDIPYRAKRVAKEFRNLSRLIRGKNSSSSLNTNQSARHAVGNTGFHRAYPSLGVRGYGRQR